MTANYRSAQPVDLHNDRISDEDAERQMRAADEILRRFERQPGVILADEVGMGKTFVALSVAVSVLNQTSREFPVVVMSPSTLRDKWPGDWDVFREKCLSEEMRSSIRARTADSGVEFLRLLDDTEADRAHIIFLSHGALHKAVGDPFVKLALIKRAFKGRSSLTRQRVAISRYAGTLVWADWVERCASGVLGQLLEKPYDTWLSVLHRAHPSLVEKVPDDPVPKHLWEVLEAMPSSEFDALAEALRSLPQRYSENIADRLKVVRASIAGGVESLWRKALQGASFRSPLLILDEAHHVKNPATRLASLFVSEDAVEDSKFFQVAGPLGGKFDRMLFLTATPFQLGHAELIRVLERFEGIRWKSNRAPLISRTEFTSELSALAEVLDMAQATALHLDRSWGRLKETDIIDSDGNAISVEDWWTKARKEEGDGDQAELVRQSERTKASMDRAEKSLSPWVLRHVKPTHLANHATVRRREEKPGAAIQAGGDPLIGLRISTDVLLPFLLAGRAQTLFASDKNKKRAVFAEGLASSFEAYLDTRRNTVTRDEDVDEGDGISSAELEWYLEHLDKSLPRTDGAMRSSHPKVKATAEKAIELWRNREKVLIFCHYRATGRALRQHISVLLDAEIIRLAQAKLPDLSVAEVRRTLNNLSDRFFEDDKLRSAVSEWASQIVASHSKLSPDENARVVEVVRRFVRTPSFLARYLPLNGKTLIRDFLDAVDEESKEQQSLRRTVDHFCLFLSGRVPEERNEFLAALESVQTGSHLGKEVRQAFDPGEGIDGTDETAVLLPNVRLANGEVRQETRRRLLLTFNTPLFPEILIASSVMAEGVDLHLNCRYVIHHDLCWNPSTLEQRSGRVDRIGCKAERVGRSINLYLPYVAATQDEKMFRVVKDRERWFQIVMGETYSVDEATTDRQAARVPLPKQLQEELSMRLH